MIFIVMGFAAANWLAGYLVLVVFVGGSAINGYAADGQYALHNHGVYTTVPGLVYGIVMTWEYGIQLLAMGPLLYFAVMVLRRLRHLRQSQADQSAER